MLTVRIAINNTINAPSKNIYQYIGVLLVNCLSHLSTIQYAIGVAMIKAIADCASIPMGNLSGLSIVTYLRVVISSLYRFAHHCLIRRYAYQTLQIRFFYKSLLLLDFLPKHPAKYN